VKLIEGWGRITWGNNGWGIQGTLEATGNSLSTNLNSVTVDAVNRLGSDTGVMNYLQVTGLSGMSE
jgi:uncharacterized lipoprotein YajG